LGGFASAQTPAKDSSPVPIRIRGAIDRIDGKEMRLVTRSGENVTLRLADNVEVRLIVPLAIDAIKPGSFIGTAAMPQPDGTLKAREVHVFPESMRGTGEGHRPWDLETGSTMTNGTVGDFAVANGRMLTLTYKGGEQKVFVPESVPVITYEAGSRADLKTGAHVFVTGTHNGDESLTAVRIAVGKNGLVPPM
jgi:hypothetical protein